MKLSWLRTLSATIGIEGRNTVVVALLLFCSSGIFAFLRDYKDHSLLSLVFLIAFFLFAVAIGFVGLLAKPRPSEVVPKYFVQQVGPQIFMAGGIQSSEELVELLKAAHNIHQLPLPVATVKGKATDETNYKELSVSEAQTISMEINSGVQSLVRAEAQRIVDTVNANQLPQGPNNVLTSPETARREEGMEGSSGQKSNS